MQWLLQEFEDTHRLAEALDQLEISYTRDRAFKAVVDKAKSQSGCPRRVG